MSKSSNGFSVDDFAAKSARLEAIGKDRQRVERNLSKAEQSVSDCRAELRTIAEEEKRLADEIDAMIRKAVPLALKGGSSSVRSALISALLSEQAPANGSGQPALV